MCGGKGYVAAVEWGHGRYEVIAEQLFPAAEVVVGRADPDDGDRVLDLGCGTGNAALLAAERGATVTGVDPAERLVSVAADEAAARGLDARFVVGSAADLPLADDSVDVVVSVFGVIFAPDAEAAAAEIDRVTAPGGRAVISAWIPEGTMFRAVRLMRETIGPLLDRPPPAGRPFAWHEQGALEGLGGASPVVALARYEASRDRLSKALYDVTESVSRYDWDADQVRALLRRVSSAMSDEVDHLVAREARPLDHV